MQNVGRAPNRIYQSELYAAQDEEKRMTSCRRCGAEKETSEYIKIRMQILGSARMDPDQKKVPERISLSPLLVEPGGSKDQYV